MHNSTILNEYQIVKRMVSNDEGKRIIITPLINSRQQFGPNSIDLRLGTDFKIIKTSGLTHLNPLKNKDDIIMDIIKYTESIEITPGDEFILHPRDFVLASTLEYIVLPDDIAARIEGRSTWARLGLEVHATAGFVDPGFRGALTFELQNCGKVPIPLHAGIRIGQLCFFEMSEPSNLPYHKKEFTKYSKGIGTVISKYFNDPEYEILRKSKNI